MAGVKKSAPPYAKRRWGALLVPRAGIEPARTFVHWCLRPTRLPIPPSGLIGSAAKIRQLLEVADTDSLHYTMRSIPLLLDARSTIAFHS